MIDNIYLDTSQMDCLIKFRRDNIKLNFQLNSSNVLSSLITQSYNMSHKILSIIDVLSLRNNR